MDLKALDISMSRCSLLDSCSAKRHNNNNNKLRRMLFALHKTDIPLRKTGFPFSRKRRLLVAPVPDAQ